MGVGCQTRGARQTIGNVDNSAPFSKFCAQRVIFAEAFAQAVQPFGHHFPSVSGHGFGTSINFDAGQ